MEQRHLKLFGHIARAVASEDLSRALRASTDRLPLIGTAQEADLVSPGFEQSRAISKMLNLGLHSALQRATDRPSWQRIVETAMLIERATWWWWWVDKDQGSELSPLLFAIVMEAVSREF